MHPHGNFAELSLSSPELYAKQRRLSAMAADLAFEKERASRMMIGILSQVVEKRNGESRDHVQRVAQLTSMLLAGLAQKTDSRKNSRRSVPARHQGLPPFWGQPPQRREA